MTVVTRFAPSPTGHLHIGGARTAIFCWLLARHFGGKFLLRVEDTDMERSKEEYTTSILASMRWLGLDTDGEPYFQSQRMAFYKECVDKMLASGHAYWCSCTPDEVEAMREKARAEGKKPRYDGRCREMGLGPGPGRVVRLKAPLTGEVAFDDMVKGHVVFPAEELDDMVLYRSDDTPTYNMAVVADDIDMGITHVLRGDDHVNNTPKQVLIYQALGHALPIFAHVPMILGPDKQKLSKRHGAKAVIEYEKDGLLPSAILNYMVRLGWSHGDQELFTIPELVAAFDGTSLNSAPASFDPEKLLWVNAHHMRETPAATLVELVKPFLDTTGLAAHDQAYYEKLVSLYQPRAATLVDLAREMRCLLLPAAGLEYDAKARDKALTAEGKAHLAGLRSELADADYGSKEALHEALQRYLESAGAKFKAIGPIMRLALLGSLGGPGLDEIMELLGKDETLARIDRVMSMEI
ncbi:glutamate--tRNA ligase [Desulfovibrio sp. OttesenSCG-928-I05]|nr:glutamate--tRNA ligase [Desulfovibrio sp. OttesenSCG-928-I05]